MERKWEPSKYEKLFEKYLIQDNFDFEIRAEYLSKTVYYISKEGLHIIWEFPLIKIPNMKVYYKEFLKTFDLYKRFLV